MFEKFQLKPASKAIDPSANRSHQILLAIQNSIPTLFEIDFNDSEAIHATLRKIGKPINASRVYMFNTFENNDGETLITPAHEWAAPQTESLIKNPKLQNVTLADLGIGRWQDLLSSGQVIHSKVSELPLSEQAVLIDKDVKFITVFPIFVNHSLRGLIGFDESNETSSWNEVELSAFKTFSKILGNALDFIEFKEATRIAKKEAADVQRKIHDALESAEHGVWEWDLTTDKVYYSEILQKQLGYNGHEFSDALSEWSGRVHPDDLEKTIQEVQEHIKGKTPNYRAEFRMRKKDGSYAWMLAIARVIKDKNGKPIRLSGTHTDLTPQKELEAELVKQQKILESLINDSPDLIWLKDAEGVYLAANKRFEDLYGRSRKEIIGNTDYDFVSKELADFFRDHDKRAMHKDGSSMNEETLTFAKDGHQEVLETIKTPIKQQDGTLLGVLGVGRDITERKELQAQQSLAAKVFSNAHEGIIICDKNSLIIDVNPIFEEISGYSKKEIMGKNPRTLSSGRQNKTFYQNLWAELKTNGFWRGELWNRKKSGEFYAILSNISVIFDEEGKVSHYLSVFTDISYLKTHQEQLENMAHYDPLTQMPNRALLSDRLDQAIIQADRRNELLAVCFIDLDNFKPINDTLGHSAGDKLLIELSKRIQNHIREEDTLARIGGDEFVLLLKEQSSKESISKLANYILELTTEPFEINGKRINLSASMGVSIYPHDRSNSDGLIRHADQAMYEAKQLGKNQCYFFDVDAAQAYQAFNQSIAEIQKALKHSEFTLYLQPKVSLSKKTIIGFEALIRWNHPTKGLLFPNAFLSTLEGHQLTQDLDNWVVNQAFKYLCKLKENEENFVLSINISPTSLLSSVFISELESQLQKHVDVNPSNLEIEVLETSDFIEIEIARKNLKKIQKLGIRVALDDFGTGASSLSYLKNLPTNIIKIDQSFIFDILVDKSDLAIVEGIIQLARIFNLEVIAEGVETIEQAQKLYDLGCDLIQGYWISKPLPANELPNFIDNWSLPEGFPTTQ